MGIFINKWLRTWFTTSMMWIVGVSLSLAMVINKTETWKVLRINSINQLQIKLVVQSILLLATIFKPVVVTSHNVFEAGATISQRLRSISLTSVVMSDTQWNLQEVLNNTTSTNTSTPTMAPVTTAPVTIEPVTVAPVTMARFVPPLPAPTATTIAPFTLHINSGSTEDYIDANGKIWKSDTIFTNTGGMYNVCPLKIFNMTLDSLYCKERYFNKWVHVNKPFRYEIPVPRVSSAYTVKLHFSEINFRAARERVFDVWINFYTLLNFIGNLLASVCSTWALRIRYPLKNWLDQNVPIRYSSSERRSVFNYFIFQNCITRLLVSVSLTYWLVVKLWPRTWTFSKK